MTGYVKVARVDDLDEGTGRTVDAGGRWLAVFRVGDRVYAIDNACPHMAGPLGAGTLEGTIVTCPLHGWRIDLATGRSTTNAQIRVPRFDTAVENGWIWVRMQ